MIAATANESNGKSSQATFLKVGQNLYRNESSETYYGLTKRGGKQFRIVLRIADGTSIMEPLSRRTYFVKWLADLENIDLLEVEYADRVHPQNPMNRMPLCHE